MRHYSVGAAAAIRIIRRRERIRLAQIKARERELLYMQIYANVSRGDKENFVFAYPFFFSFSTTHVNMREYNSCPVVGDASGVWLY